MPVSSQSVLGIEIGGTKLQIGLGGLRTDTVDELWRADIDARLGAERIRAQIVEGAAALQQKRGLSNGDVAGVGIGFGGPVDAANGRTMTSHQVKGWNDFALGDWIREELDLPAVIQNDADTAALAEAHYGAGRGFDSVLFLTVGSGIGGGLILHGKIFRGSGRGAAEIGHLRPGHLPENLPYPGTTVERIASGFGITKRAQQALAALGSDASFAPILQRADNDPARITTKLIAQAAADGDEFCCRLLHEATETLGWAIAQAITLVNPARIVIGGGVSLIGEELFFDPIRAACACHVFEPFTDVAEIVPAELGEEVVIHGALALARDAFTA